MPIPLESAQPGMVLANDVRDRRGRLLLPAGYEVTPRALRIFRMWGVTQLEVEDPRTLSPSGSDPAIAPERFDAARERAEAIFCHADRQHPLMAELFRLATRRLAREPIDAP